MFSFKFSLENPFVRKDRNKQSFLFFKGKKISKNKNLTFQVAKWSPREIFCFDLEVSGRGHSHAGAFLEFEVLGLEFRVELYDRRHWDYENDKWKEIDA